MEVLVEFGIHSTKREESLETACASWRSTSLGESWPRNVQAQVRYLCERGAEDRVIYLLKSTEFVPLRRYDQIAIRNTNSPPHARVGRAHHVLGVEGLLDELGDGERHVALGAFAVVGVNTVWCYVDI